MPICVLDVGDVIELDTVTSLTWITTVQGLANELWWAQTAKIAVQVENSSMANLRYDLRHP